MKKYILDLKCSSIPPNIGDVVTPVSVYLSLRDLFPNTILLESSDYHGGNNSMSFVCFDPVADFIVDKEEVVCRFPDGLEQCYPLPASESVPDLLTRFISSFILKGESDVPACGLYGYTNYDAVRYFEDVDIKVDSEAPNSIPDMRYHLYKSVIAFNHFTNKLYFVEHLCNSQESQIDSLLEILKNRTVSSFGFQPSGDEVSPLSDQQYKTMVNKGKEHCYRGDVFQIVLSRLFSQSFTGDEFNVYRALRNINPSPYLFYFDYGGYRLFGSSPESQLVVENGVATINPIAGTFKRTGDDMQDFKLAEKLAADVKENAEHVMLVDLARNDLARNCKKVEVTTFKEIQYYSHVLHLVSEVKGELKGNRSIPRLMGDTFPAGTLSGAPKHKALELINRYEPHQRSFYGGCIGKIGFDSSFNQAITIRSFLSKNNRLFYQAGAGVVSESDDISELNEVSNKLGALKKAIKFARQF
ncbi:anthranilate synthase component I family protein [Marinilabiliaceae bacterium ANBcel2]|nr:anthranilate synthase component I family protein [Marinilabiliaceae bacterium ANBcel2]